jgi:hypothetical protein
LLYGSGGSEVEIFKDINLKITKEALRLAAKRGCYGIQSCTG